MKYLQTGLGSCPWACILPFRPGVYFSLLLQDAGQPGLHYPREEERAPQHPAEPGLPRQRGGGSCRVRRRQLLGAVQVSAGLRAPRLPEEGLIGVDDH